MAKAKLLKASILSHGSLSDSIMTDLHKIGVMHLKKTEDIEGLEGAIGKVNREASIERELIEIEKAIKSISAFVPQGGFLQSMLPSVEYYDELEFKEIVDNFNRSIIKDINEEAGHLIELESNISNLEMRLNELRNWEAFDVEIDYLLSLSHVGYFWGILDNNRYELFKEKIEEEHLATLYQITRNPDKTYFFVVYHREIKDKINTIASEFGVSYIDLTAIKNGVKKEIAEVSATIEKDTQRIKEIESLLESYVKYYKDLVALKEYTVARLERARARAFIYESKNIVLIEGYVKEKDISRLKKIETKYKEVDIRLTEPSEDDNLPVALENKKLINPFEAVVKLFGLPGKSDVDPTPLIMPFFALFFALCLTDAGYGLIMLFMAIMIKKKLPLKEGSKKIMNILIIAGSLTVFVGAMAGGFFGIFGIDFASMPEGTIFHAIGESGWFNTIKHWQEQIVLFDPLKSPLTFFAIALSLGIIQVIAGFTIKFVTLLKSKKITDAVYDNLSWILIILAPVSYIIFKNMYLSVGLFAIGFLLILFFAGRGAGNPFVRLAKGMYELYGITSIFGDVLSYSRLFALGLSTSVIAAVINVISLIVFDMLRGFGPVGVVLGILITALIILFGHVFNTVINALGGFIHTTRLQFVEFFTKFYEDGGEEFKPFKEEHQEIAIVGQK